MKKHIADATKIALFKGTKIRRVLYQNEWWFSIVDVISALTESTIPRRYWTDLKRKLIQEGFRQLYEKIVQLKIESSDGKKYLTDCANTETVFRIVQTISSPKAVQSDRLRFSKAYVISSTFDKKKYCFF